MPVIPTFENTVPYPTPNLPRMDVQGAGLAADALARGAAGVSDEAGAIASQYAAQKRAIAASDAMVGVDQQLGDAATRWGRVADKDQAVAGFNDEAQQIRKKALGGVQDPLIQGVLAQRIDEGQIIHSHSVEASSFGLEASKARGDLDTQLAQLAQTASTAPTPEGRAQAIDDANRAIAARSPLYLEPEQAAKESIQFRSNVQKNMAFQYIRNASEGPNINRLSPLEIANTINDPNNFPGLLPNERQSLSDTAVRLSRTIVSMRMADEAHADAMADKNQKKLQAANAADAITAVDKGQRFDPAEIDAGVRSGKYSEAGFTAILAAQTRKETGTDNPTIAAGLWKRANAGDASAGDEALTAYERGDLSRPTAVAMNKTINERATQNQSELEKQNWAVVKTIAKGDAVEKGMVDLTGDYGKSVAALYASAQQEWAQRVTINKESSTAVMQDMAKRYQRDDVTLQGLRPPRLGAIHAAADVATIAQKTQSAFDAGTLSPEQFETEKALIVKYQQLYQQQTRPAAPAGAGGKAASLGASPTE